MEAEDKTTRRTRDKAIEPLQLNTQIGQLNKALLADLISFQLFMSHQTPW
jgi:hypothetical protein